MKVRSAPGLKCPMEGLPRTYVTSDKPVDVPDTSYYRRLVKDGSLVRAEDDPRPEAWSGEAGFRSSAFGIQPTGGE